MGTAGDSNLAFEAQQYPKVPPTLHTSNKWVKGEYDWHEISNMVYKFTWHVYEKFQLEPCGTKSIIHSYDLSWYLTYNTPREPDYTGPGRQIAGQERKHFLRSPRWKDICKGRIKAYAHLFTEISPPIPAEEKRRFCVNGVLLPGYTVEITMDQAVSDLLWRWQDDDLAALAQDASTRHQFRRAVRRHRQETHTQQAPQAEMRTHQTAAPVAPLSSRILTANFSLFRLRPNTLVLKCSSI